MTFTKDVMKFPCTFPLKVMGFNTEEFLAAATGILQKHLNPDGISYSKRLSKENKYLAITATFTAQSKAQLDAIYRDLNNHPLVLMTL